MALPRDPLPEPLAQLVEPFPLRPQLPLQPQPQGRIVRPAAEHLPQFGIVFGRGGQLRSAAPLQLLAALPLPPLATRLPEHLALQAGG